MNRLVHRVYVPIIILLLALAGCQTKPTAETAPRIKLAVIISVDEMAQDLVDRYGHLFGEGGIKKMMIEGAWFSDCNFSHAALQTGPGHSIIGTGCNPAKSSIAANSWKRRDSDGWMYCVASTNSKEVDNSGVTDIPASSPENLQVETLGDRLRSATDGNAKVVSLSLKDRAAILMGGHTANEVIWWHNDTGDFVTSTYYSDTLPQWCFDYNADRYVDQFFHKTWDRLFPLDAYRICDDDTASYETGEKCNLSNTFPKIIGEASVTPDRDYYTALGSSPFGNDLLIELAKRAIQFDSLGQDTIPDILWISFSSNDRCGHLFGPHSHELLDLTVRTDRQVAQLLQFLDSTVGLEQCVIALTADHGLGPAPESKLNKEKVGGRLNFRQMRKDLHKALKKQFDFKLEENEWLVPGFGIPWIYLDEQIVAREQLNMDELVPAIIEIVGEMEGVERICDTRTLAAIADIEDDNLRSHLQQNFWPGASGQLYMHVKYGWTGDGICANHGTIHRYDTHVPLIFFGEPFKQGRYVEGVDPADLVPTIAAALKLPPLDNVDGEVLTTCMK